MRRAIGPASSILSMRWFAVSKPIVPITMLERILLRWHRPAYRIRRRRFLQRRKALYVFHGSTHQTRQPHRSL
jgi:hypothetical protein